jgi:DNA-binding CsgD family transcriptional regulator
MSHFDSTTIEQQFEDRFAPIDRTLQVWGVRAYPGKGDLARDEALQQTRIVMWKRFSEDPDAWSANCAKVWVTYAKKVYGHAVLHERIVEAHTDYAEEMVRKDGGDLTGEEALTNKLREQRQQSRYSREILLADDRIDLERAIQRGFATLPERYHADMRLLMLDIMEGYSQVEIEHKRGWTNNHMRVLFRHLRTTFYEALTGHKRERCGYVGNKAPATDEELYKLRELRSQGLSYVKIAARLDYSPGWVMQNLRRLHEHRPTFAEREQMRAEQIAAVQALLAQGLGYREIARTLNTSYNTVRRLLGKC